MKACPQCESGYHDSLTTCPTHGGMLNEIRDLRPGMLIRDTYRIVRKLGRGGMGTVYLAQHTLLDEPRALKFLSPDLTEDQDFTARFLREVRTLHQIRNRNVVDCGDPERAEDGSLFFSMEYVNGPSLHTYLKSLLQPLNVEQALAIAWGIASGLGAAHAKGMVHRDIKPDNILMAREADRLIPKIADFGLVATKESSQQTRTGDVLLTMAYAAPEQWIGTRAADLDGRADFYALGGVLFEMLTGHKPFEAETYHGWAQQHMNVQPPPPSSLRPELANWRGLDALVLRLLAKDKNQRPRDVAELLAQLESVVYEPPVPRQVPVPQAAPFAYTPSEVRPPAVDAGQSPAEAVPLAEAPPGAPESNSGSLYKGLGRTTHRPPAKTREQAGAKRSKGASALISVASLLLLAGLGFAALHFYVPKVKSEALQSQTEAIVSVAFNPSGLILASDSRDRTIQFWSMETKNRLLTLKTDANAITFSPDGRSLASADTDQNVRIWDTGTGLVLATLAGHSARVLSVAFSQDGRILASGSSDTTIRLWDTAAEKLLRILSGNTLDVTAVAFSPDGKTLASGGADQQIRLWDPASGKLLRTLRGHSRRITAVLYSPDGRTLASASDDMTIKLWNPASGELGKTLQGHTGPVLSLAFSPDGRTLASASADTTVKLWDLNGASAGYTLRGHTAAVQAVAFNGDATILASGSADTTVQLWDISTIER